MACTAAGAAWRLGANPGPHADGALAFIEQVLGDSNDDYIYIDHIDRVQIEAMRRNCSVDKYEKELRHRIIELRLFYDWPALKSAVRIWPASDSDRFKINDLWNVLD